MMKPENRISCAEGSMTLFFALLFVLLAAIIGGCLESARIAASDSMAQMAASSAVNSFFADYEDDLWKKYHVFFRYEAGSIENRLWQGLSVYETTDGSEENGFWNLRVEEVSLMETVTALDNGGEAFFRQAVAYETLSAGSDVISGLLSQVGLFDRVMRIKDAAETIASCYDQLNRISDTYQNLRDLVNSLEGLCAEASLLLSGETIDEPEILLDDFGRLLAGVESALDLCELFLQDAQAIGRVTTNLVSGVFGDSVPEVTQALDALTRVTENGEIGKAVRNFVSTASSVIRQLQLVEKDLVSLAESKERDDTEAVIASAKTVIADGAALFSILPVFSQEGSGDNSVTEPVEPVGASNVTDLLARVRGWKGTAILNLMLGSDLAEDIPAILIGTSGAALPSSIMEEKLTGYSTADSALYLLYCVDTFSNYTEASLSGIPCQTEYLLFGKEDSRSNIAAAMERILAIREAIDLLYLLTDPESNASAQAAATAVLGFSPLSFLIPALKMVILASWAFAEARYDLQELAKGHELVLWKTDATWHTGINGLDALGISDAVSAGTIRFSYADYLKVMLLTVDTDTLVKRSLDLVQEEIALRRGGFLLSRCYSELTAEVTFSSPSRLAGLFLSGDRRAGFSCTVTYAYPKS